MTVDERVPLRVGVVLTLLLAGLFAGCSLWSDREVRGRPDLEAVVVAAHDAGTVRCGKHRRCDRTAYDLDVEDGAPGVLLQRSGSHDVGERLVVRRPGTGLEVHPPPGGLGQAVLLGGLGALLGVAGSLLTRVTRSAPAGTPSPATLPTAP